MRLLCPVPQRSDASGRILGAVDIARVSYFLSEQMELVGEADRGLTVAEDNLVEMVAVRRRIELSMDLAALCFQSLCNYANGKFSIRVSSKNCQKLMKNMNKKNQ